METSFTTRNVLPSHSATALLFLADCSTSPDPFHCRLDQILHLLYIAAILLAIVLLIVAVLAYRAYLQNKADAEIEKKKKS